MSKATETKKVNGSDFLTIIVSKGGNICLLKANTANKKYSKEVLEGVASDKDTNATRINCLSILVDVLTKIQANPMDGIMNIHTVGLVKKSIDEGYFKYWVETGKTQKSELSELELDLWKKYSELACDPTVIMHVNIKDVPSQRQQARNDKKSSNQRDPSYDFLLEMSSKAWEQVKEPEPEEAAIDTLPF